MKINLSEMKGGIMMKSKKGISAVVATVLIILITVAAVTIIWAAIIPMVKENLDRGTICLDAVSQLTILDKGYTCFNNNENQVRVQVGHGPKDFNLAGIQVLVSDNAGGTSAFEETDVGNLPGVNEEKVIVFVGYTPDNAQSVRVAPMVKIGNSVEACDALAAVDLKAC